MILGLAGSIGAIFLLLLLAKWADRYFSTEKILAVLVSVGGIVKWVTASQSDYQSWLILSIIYSILYIPTLALSEAQFLLPILMIRRMTSPEFDGNNRIASSWIFPMFWLQTDLKFQLLPPFFVGIEYPDVTSRLADALRLSG